MRYKVDSFKVAIGIAVLIAVLGFGVAIGGAIAEPLSEKEIKILIDTEVAKQLNHGVTKSYIDEVINDVTIEVSELEWKLDNLDWKIGDIDSSVRLLQKDLCDLMGNYEC